MTDKFDEGAEKIAHQSVECHPYVGKANYHSYECYCLTEKIADFARKCAREENEACQKAACPFCAADWPLDGSMHFYPDATVPARVLCGALSIRARKP